MDPINETRDTRSIASLFGELTHEMRLLFQQEVQLARVEVGEKVSQVQRGATALGIGAAICYAGFLALLAAAFFGLALVVDAWLAALIVGVVSLIIGLSFVAKGREDLRSNNMALNRTTETLQEDKKWIKAQMR